MLPQSPGRGSGSASRSPILPATRLDQIGNTTSIASQAVTGELTGLMPAAYLSSATPSPNAAQAPADEELDGLDVPIGVRHLFQGAIGDWRRRARHMCTSDYRDGCAWQTISAGLFTFFGLLATTISLGYRIQLETNGQIGYLEYMLMNAVAGLVYATVEAQPYVVVQPTAPITMLLSMLCGHAESREFEFLPFVAATGVWVCFWLTLASALNIAGLIRYMSRFTGEVFAVFIGTTYIQNGIDGIIARFARERTDPSAVHIFGERQTGARRVCCRCVFLSAVCRATHTRSLRGAAGLCMH